MDSRKVLLREKPAKERITFFSNELHVNVNVNVNVKILLWNGLHRMIYLI